MKFYLLLFLFPISFCLTAQLNTEFVGNLPYNQAVNDIWGWVDKDGTEYALVGLQTGVSVVSLANPSAPVEVAFADGPSSTWRDMKTWENFGYAINETGDGLLVMDLSYLPDSLPYSYWSPQIEGLGQLNTCHNLYVDENGIAYLAGCNLNGGGPLLVDVKSNPGNPIYIGKTTDRYAHDVYAEDSLLYTSDIYQGIFSIFDVSNIDEPVLLGTQETPFSFTHNTWISEDGNTLFTTDERANAPVAAYDISDYDNIQKLDEFRPMETINTGVIPHNVHVLNDFLVISHYTDGLVIVDAQRPSNLVEIGNYDTFQGDGQGFSGAWGAYPFLPSGLVLVSDRQSGLFIIDPNYVSAAYLEGIVQDQFTNTPLNDAKITLNAPNAAIENTDFSGTFATGTSEAGTYEVTFSRFGYFSKTIEVDLNNGEVTELVVELEPRIRIDIFGRVVEEENSIPINDATIAVFNSEVTYTAQSDAAGNFNIPDVFEGEYEVVVGAWGYEQKLLTVSGTEDQNIQVRLAESYEDDFVLDLGWEVISNAASGNWELAEPIGTGSAPNYVNPEFDVEGDIGDQCYMTGNGGDSAGFDDVDDGETILISPIMDLSNYENPILNYRTWFYNGGGNNTEPDDFLRVSISNGVDTILLEEITESASLWRPSPEWELTELIDLTDNMRLFFETEDLSRSGHLVEAGVDAFSVVESDMVNTSEISVAIDYELYPNPFSDQIWLELPTSDYQTVTVQLFNAQGQLLQRIDIPNAHRQLLPLPSDLSAGVYWVQLLLDGQMSEVKQVMRF